MERDDVGGGRAVREPPLRGVGHTVACDGRRRGLPLGEEGTERDDVGGGRAVREPPLRGEVGFTRSHVTGDDEGRPYGGEGTERDDVGGGRAVREPPLWERLVERSHVTGDDEGRPYVGKRWRGMVLEGEGPRCADRRLRETLVRTVACDG